MFGPYPSAAVEARLRDKVGTLRLVGNAADLQEALKAAPSAVPAAFVLRTERGDQPQGYSSSFTQTIRVALQVVLWVRNFAGSAGSGARDDMDALQNAVRAALINWTPSTEFDALNLEAERDESFRAGDLVTQSIFRSSYRLQTGANP